MHATTAVGDPEKAEYNHEDNGNGLKTANDDALPAHVSPEIEKRLLKKLDRRLVSLVFGLCRTSYHASTFTVMLIFILRPPRLPRPLKHWVPSNLPPCFKSLILTQKSSNAKIAGLADDLSLSSDDYQWLLTIFYISYIIFEWFALMWKLVPPHMWAAFCVMGWGLTATLQAATFSFSGMMAARFFLGFFEAGYGPGIPYLLSFFYLRHEIGFRSGLFLSAAPLATCFAGALAYGITSNNNPPIANWRILFLVEGLPCLVAAVVTYFVLPDSPEKASFLTPEEKAVARSRALRQVGKDERAIGRINFKDIGVALIDPKVHTPFHKTTPFSSSTSH